MIVYKISLLIQVTTDPLNRVWATPHSGGWSEGVWSLGLPDFSSGGGAYRWAAARANVLPFESAIVGYRISVYNLASNKLTPAGTSAGKLLFPGTVAYTQGNPQAGLELGWPANAGPNSSRIVLRGLPDEVIVKGEFSGDATFRAAITRMTTALNNIGPGWVGRDLGQPSATVNMIAGTTVTLSQVLGGLAVGDFLRFRKVRADSGAPIKGSFLVTAIVGLTVVLQGYTGGNVTKPNGTARKDVVTFILGGTPTIGRAVVKKIGRPFESYRGRRSKTTV
jgi:hypothetical protein